MKKLAIILSLVVCSIAIIFSAKLYSNNPEKKVVAVTEEFFNYFEKSDYESMKLLCTQNCVDNNFHDNNVWGMIWAKPTSIGTEIRKLSEGDYTVFIDANISPVDPSLYDTETVNTSFYITLQKQANGKWLVDGFTTG